MSRGISSARFTQPILISSVICVARCVSIMAKPTRQRDRICRVSECEGMGYRRVEWADEQNSAGSIPTPNNRKSILLFDFEDSLSRIDLIQILMTHDSQYMGLNPTLDRDCHPVRKYENVHKNKSATLEQHRRKRVCSTSTQFGALQRREERERELITQTALRKAISHPTPRFTALQGDYTGLG